MKVSAEQISRHLNQEYLPAYLICGDEPLQQVEAADSVRIAYREAGFCDREIFDVEPGFDWGRFELAARSLGLFAERKLIELRFGSGLPDQRAAKNLMQYFEHQSEATVLLMTCGKLAKSKLKAKWFVEFDRLGGIVQARLLKGRSFRSWLAARAKSRGIELDSDALHALVIRAEGNMLAAAQEVDKLFVLYGASRIDSRAIRRFVADSAQFTVFDLVDCALTGEVERCSRILHTLRREGIATQVILWALHRELDLLAKLRYDLDRGASREKAFGEHKVWESRRGLLENALKRHKTRPIHELVKHCAYIDRLGKGLAQGDVWRELWCLCLSIAGKNPLPVTSH